MSNVEWLAIGQLFTFLAAVFAYLQSRHNTKTNNQNNEASRAAIQEIHLTVNGRLAYFKEQTEKLLEVSVAAARIEGIEEERNREK